jgi:hypothetical protein
MKDRDIIKRLRKLGFPLFETEKAEDANLTLADVIKSKDLRFWEGFPVVLATAAENGLFDYNKVAAALKKPLDKLLLTTLVAMSLALYKNLGVKFPWISSLRDLLRSENKKEYGVFLTAFEKNDDLNIGGRTLSAERLKSVFKNYFRKEKKGLHELLFAKEDMGLEYAMSQVFSPKQKELFLKKLRGELLTKTEKEYFSRAVKKKVLALANADLHRLSCKLLGE